MFDGKSARNIIVALGEKPLLFELLLCEPNAPTQNAEVISSWVERGANCSMPTRELDVLIA
jgi:hypothetical protein